MGGDGRQAAPDAARRPSPDDDQPHRFAQRTAAPALAPNSQLADMNNTGGGSPDPR